jgi:PAS domain S-box-containing protein
MMPFSPNGEYPDGSREVCWEDGERVFCRGWRPGDDGKLTAVLVVLPAAERPSPSSLDRLAHEYELKDELDGAWAVQPRELVRDGGRTMLVLDDPGLEPLDRLLGEPIEVGCFLRLAIGIASAVGKLHQRGLVHKDIKPANILVSRATGTVRLTGFGIASRLARERQSLQPPETIAGTLAYMAPEQTGRMNRSIDFRSDLYSLGITLYRMLTGSLPFIAADPMEWVHCHIARKPVPPAERLEKVPPPLSAIIMKLLAKTVEERYQTAGGVERDLQRCLTDWNARGCIDDFPLGQQDTPDRLLIPEKLYGREREIATLVAAFDRIVKSGTPELLLVSGYSGIGKSSVVNELHKVLVPPRGLFASGKFDQYKRDIPYSTLAQAFQSLVRPLLGKGEAELASWRDVLREALGPNGQLMVDLVPELKLIIGDQPAVPDLAPQDAQRRFQLVFRRFIGVFARPEHPLTLFFDDLQWLDAATLDLLEDLLTQPDVQHLLVIGAYRDNEVDAAHPLARKLDAIRNTGAKIEEITLAPLACEHLGHLLVDALRREPKRVVPLAQLVHEKTGGNPFFAIQFISALAEAGLLRFDHDAACWSWSLDRIRAEGYTDNVVELMVGKLARLPAETQAALRQLACVGNAAEVTILLIAFGTSEAQVHADLREAVRLELVERQEGTYKFVHDRVQEAAYSLIPEAARAEAHLRIGRLLAAQTPLEKREETIFEIVNQLNRAGALITSQDERDQLAEFNLIAGKRAKASAAYASALNYLIAGAALLADDCWERRHELAFSLEINRAECEFLTGELAAEQRLAALSARATDAVEQATVACLRVDLYTKLDQSSRAAAVGLEYLRLLGIAWSPQPTEEEARREYELIWSTLADRPIEALVELPLMSDPASLATLDVVTKLATPAWYTDANLLAVVTCRAVNLSLAGGNCDASCFAYVLLGLIAGPRFGDYQAGYRFGRLGYDLVERRGLTRFQARTYLDFGNLVLPWTRHVHAGRDLIRRAFEAANKNGDLTYASYCGNRLTTILLAAGDPLVDVQREAEDGLAFAQKARFGFAIDRITAQLTLIRTLRGLTPTFGSFDDEPFDETRIERRFSENPDLALAECWYWVRKLQACFFAGDYASAIEASSRAQRLLWTSPSFFETAEYHFYGALSRAAFCDCVANGERQQHLDAVAGHHKQLQLWAANCPENFGNRAALVGAEIARIDGRDVDAMRLYEQAIGSARANGFIHNEALAYELAARFYTARGFEKIARVYLQDARYGYLRWGADGKVGQLDEMYPDLREKTPASAPTGTIGAPVEHLDLETVIKVSQAVSGEIELETLIDTLMRTALEQAGAERGLLIVSHGAEPRIAAQATTGDDGIIVRLHDEAVTAAVLPASVIRYVVHTKENVILDDAAAQNPFSGDPYIRQHRARSILCMPLLNQGKLAGVLYLENNLTPRVFTSTRLAVLKMLASQASISLENARLYRDLKEREAKIRHLVDANIIGIFIWDFEGRILEANEAFLHMVGYDHEELVAGRLRWTDLTPPDWRDRDARWVQEHKMTGTLRPIEKEYFRKDGSRVPVLIGAVTFDEGGDQGVAFVLDLTERKCAEEALRESEYKLRQIIETVPGLIWSNGPGGEPTHINGPMLDYSGMSFEAFKRRGWEAFVHPADFPETAKAFYHAIQTGTSYEGAMRLRRADGEFRWHHARGEPLRDRQGRIIQWYGLSVDIDEAKKAEDRLRRSEANLAEAQRLSRTGSWALNPAMRKILYWSEECYRIWGFDPAQRLPYRAIVFQRIHPDDRDRVYKETQEALRQKRDYKVDFRIVLPEGTVKHLEAIGHHLFSADGELVQVVGTNIDVTDRKHAEQALRESEARFRDYAETASDWFWEIGPDYKFTLLTENAFGSDSADRIGTTCWDHALDLETEPEKWRLVQAALDSRQPFRDFVYCSKASGGSPMHVRASGKPVFDADGEFRGYRGTGADVTAIVHAQEEHERLRELESHLAHLNRVSVMGELTASLVHEITQPIATARNNARAATHFLDRDPPDLDEVREALACLVGDADRAGKIIDGIRDQIKKAPLRKDRFDLNDAIKEVIELARAAIVENGVAVHTRLMAGPLTVEGDRVQLQQVMLNLILNATEAMSSVAAGSRDLSISAEQSQPDVVLVVVRDTGPGIDPKDLKRVFDTFYTTKSSGMGMGLSISRSIIAAHGGRLWADLNAPRGAAFQFTLPSRAKDLANSLRTIPRAGAPREGIATGTPRRAALEGNK